MKDFDVGQRLGSFQKSMSQYQMRQSIDCNWIDTQMYDLIYLYVRTLEMQVTYRPRIRVFKLVEMTFPSHRLSRYRCNRIVHRGHVELSMATEAD